MNGTDWLAERFEANRTHLRAVAYRMLGSLSEADDVVQNAWFRLNRSDTSQVDNLDGWLTTVVARLSLDTLRARKTRREDPLEAHVPDPIIDPEDAGDPEHAALLADSVGLALLVVLDTLDPAERLAFVLHDMFGVAFGEIAPMVERSPDAARQLASRARRRVRGAAAPDVDVHRQRQIVDAFFAAARDGDFDALISVLDPDVVLRADAGPGSPLSVVHRGADTIGSGALTRFGGERRITHPARVNGTAGVIVTIDGEPDSVIAFTIIDDKIVELDVLADPERLEHLDLRNITSS